MTKREVKKACRSVPSQWHHSGDTTSNTHREISQREREIKRERDEKEKKDREKERKREKERERARERKREKREGARLDCRKRGDTYGDQKRGKKSMSQRTITVAS